LIYKRAHVFKYEGGLTERKKELFCGLISELSTISQWHTFAGSGFYFFPHSNIFSYSNSAQCCLVAKLSTETTRDGLIVPSAANLSAL
jgi:hypothetical protein